MNKLDKFAQLFVNKDPKTKPYDSMARVVRVEGDTAFVHIDGGVPETPVVMTMAVKEGDDVRVSVDGGKAYIAGNATAPPTDDSLAKKAQQNAIKAANAATEAVKQSTIAHNAADDAQRDANTARVSAENAIEDAARAHEAADNAQESADIAQEAADIAQRSAEDAQESANGAVDSANTAYKASVSALDHLSIVEDVVGVLDLISQHGTYALTTDTTVQENKWYFEKSGTGTDEKYSVVTPSEGDDPSDEGWYELVEIDTAVQNYVSSHLALTGEGLYLQTDGVSTRLLLSPNDGLVVMGTNGPLAKYGSNTLIGDETAFHITINGEKLGFWKDANTEVAYVMHDKLYITKSIVLQRMDVGQSIEDNGLGQWTWKVHANKETAPRNNLSLKWLG